MGRVRRFEVVLYKEDATFQAGDLIEGCIYLDLNEEQKCRAVRVKIFGECHTHCTDGSSSSDEYENYFSNTITLFGHEKGQSGEDLYLPAGSHEYQFSYRLPYNLPSSFEYRKQYVRYIVKSYIDIPMGFDRSAKKFFTIIRPLDLSDREEAMQPQRKQKQKDVGMWCCAAGFLNLEFQLDRMGYVPGESIICRGQANNQSRREMTSTKVTLIQKISYRTKHKHDSSSRTVAQLKKLKYAPGDTCFWNDDRLLIPPCAPSGLEGCSLIDVNYELQVSASPAGPSFDLSTNFKMLIGTIPVTQARSFTSPEMVQFGFAPNTPPPVNTLPPAYPPPSYSQCAFGSVQPIDTKDPDADGQKYAPQYTFYKFDS